MSLIAEPSRVAEARRNARRLALDLDFDDQAAERVAIVVTEASTNLLKHAGGGQIIVGYAVAEISSNGGMENVPAPLLECLALDCGPGIADLARCLEDGHSTAGTSGSGLGAIGRLASYTDIYSRPRHGTALLARLSADGKALFEPAKTGVVQAAKPGQDVCGDQWGMVDTHGYRTFLLADGLGHGSDAARASTMAVETLHKHPDFGVGELLSAVHDTLRATRGAAVAIARIDAGRGTVIFGGLGNICATVFDGDCPPRRMVSTNGTAGVEARHIREFTYPWSPGATLVMHSDGIGTRWSLSDYPGLSSHDPAVIAGVIYRDFVRGNDDATIVVTR